MANTTDRSTSHTHLMNVSETRYLNMTSETKINQFSILSPYELLLIAAPHVVYIDRSITPLWLIIGLIGNPISAVVWMSRSVRHSASAVYFGALEIIQTIYLLLHIVLQLEDAWGVNIFRRENVCESFMFLYMTPQYLAPLLVMGFTTERYLAVCHPFVKIRTCYSKTCQQIAIVTMVATSLFLGLVQMYIWKWDVDIGCVFRSNIGDFQTGWTWFTELVIFGLIPIFCFVFNIRIILAIRRLSIQTNSQSRKRASKLAKSSKTIIFVSLYFIFTLLPVTIVYALETSIPQGSPEMPPQTWAEDPVWRTFLSYLTIRKIVEEICLSSYAVNFFIYYRTRAKFRETLFPIFL